MYTKEESQRKTSGKTSLMGMTPTAYTWNMPRHLTRLIMPYSSKSCLSIHQKIIKWIESFLNDRTQQVVVDGQLSVTALIVSGVPQGTVLGPILFLIFINDITFCVTNSVICCFVAWHKDYESHIPDSGYTTAATRPWQSHSVIY